MTCDTTCFVCLLYMGVLQRDPIPKLCFAMVLTICKEFVLQIVRIFCHDLTDRSCPRLTPLCLLFFVLVWGKVNKEYQLIRQDNTILYIFSYKTSVWCCFKIDLCYFIIYLFVFPFTPFRIKLIIFQLLLMQE